MTKLDRILDRHRWTIGLAVGALAFAVGTGVRAEELNIGIAPGFMTCTTAGCAWGRLPSAEPRIIHIQQPRMPESEASVRQWYNRCHPRVVVDELGVERYQYAAAGCDLGPR